MALVGKDVNLAAGGRFARWLLRRAGWQVVYVPPPGPKSVIIVYPHTSNWDFPLGALARADFGLRCHFIAKHTLFRGPFGRWFASLGGIPVNRESPGGFIGTLAEELHRRDELHLVFTPEGTRSYAPYWKSGFYRLALAAGVPLGLAFIDYAHREVGIGAWLTLSGDEERDLDGIRAFYAGRHGRHREQEGPIRFAPDVGAAPAAPAPSATRAEAQPHVPPR
jgi:1-acyl-sn-glycerol-3-phosphate acyltransferase